jgi:hypothetical protein
MAWPRSPAQRAAAGPAGVDAWRGGRVVKMVAIGLSDLGWAAEIDPRNDALVPV